MCIDDIQVAFFEDGHHFIIGLAKGAAFYNSNPHKDHRSSYTLGAWNNLPIGSDESLRKSRSSNYPEWLKDNINNLDKFIK